MKAFLIDPEARTVAEIDIERGATGNTLPALYCALDCQLVERVADFPIEGHDGWIDEEGFLYDEPPHGLVAIPATAQKIFAGRVVVLGYDDEGDTTPATCTAEDIAREIFAVRDMTAQHVVVTPLTIAATTDNQAQAF